MPQISTNQSFHNEIRSLDSSYGLGRYKRRKELLTQLTCILKFVSVLVPFELGDTADTLRQIMLQEETTLHLVIWTDHSDIAGKTYSNK